MRQLLHSGDFPPGIIKASVFRVTYERLGMLVSVQLQYSMHKANCVNWYNDSGACQNIKMDTNQIEECVTF